MATSFPEFTMTFPKSIKNRIDHTLKLGLELAPKHALTPFSLLPHSTQEKILTWVLNYLFKSELANEELDFLNDKWLKISITDANYLCYITVNQTTPISQCRVVLNLQHSANVTFEADSISLLKLLGQTVDPDTLFFQRKLLITGDTELGLEIKNFLDDLDREAFPAIIKPLLLKYKLLSN